MPIETERKFLVDREKLYNVMGFHPILWQHETIKQYYIMATKEVTIRMRLHQDKSVLCIKYGGNGISVNELEFDLPLEDYFIRKSEMVGNELVKKRYPFYFGDKKWELDIFQGLDLMLLELEHPNAAQETFMPPCTGLEVSEDSRYKNAVLALKGYEP